MSDKKIISKLLKNLNNFNKKKTTKKDYKSPTPKQGPSDHVGQGGSRGNINL